MDSKEKLAILEHEYDLHGVFLSFCAHLGLPLHETATVHHFCDFLLDVIDDGSVSMVDKTQSTDGTHPPYAGTPEQFVAEFKRIYPTLQQCRNTYPEHPELYLEMIWWASEARSIELSPNFNLAIYEKEVF